jgi:hypothetical protein
MYLCNLRSVAPARKRYIPKVYCTFEFFQKEGGWDYRRCVCVCVCVFTQKSEIHKFKALNLCKRSNIFMLNGSITVSLLRYCIKMMAQR